MNPDRSATECAFSRGRGYVVGTKFSKGEKRFQQKYHPAQRKLMFEDKLEIARALLDGNEEVLKKYGYDCKDLRSKD